MMRGAQPSSELSTAVDGGDGSSVAHGDDSYCALCRRCQMRKKLERRLAMRRAPDSDEHDSQDSPPPRDERSITELLDYIGERGGAPARATGRRARRKRAAAVRRQALAEQHSRKGRVSRDSRPGSPSILAARHPLAEDCCAAHDFDSDVDDDDDEQSFDDPVDREVEEFRRLLEAAHVNAGTRSISPNGDPHGSR